jgi:hypothetical protein
MDIDACPSDPAISYYYGVWIIRMMVVDSGARFAECNSDSVIDACSRVVAGTAVSQSRAAYQGVELAERGSTGCKPSKADFVISVKWNNS